MSNPRRFGKITLHRVTRAMPLDKAKRKAATIRKSGVQARVDSYQGRYAVWSTKSADKDYSARLKQRERLGHICGTCEHFAANTKFKKWGGKNIIPNQCMQGRRRTTDPPFIVSPDSPCILNFDLWRRAKPKMITIYHGTNSSALKKIKRSKRVVGYWSNNPRYASLFAYTKETEASIKSRIHSVILVAEVPVSIISKHEDNYYEVLGFNFEGGQIKSSKKAQVFVHGLKIDYMTAQLPTSYIKYVLHLKPEPKGIIGEDFVRSDWVKRKL